MEILKWIGMCPPSGIISVRIYTLYTLIHWTNVIIYRMGNIDFLFAQQYHLYQATQSWPIDQCY